MVPWAEVTTVGRDAIVADLEAVLVRTGYTRVPVLAADGSTVMGFFHAKDLLTLPADAPSGPCRSAGCGDADRRSRRHARRRAAHHAAGAGPPRRGAGDRG